MDASVGSRRRLEVRRIPRGSKCALSSSTSVVDGDTSAAAEPITPAMPTARSPSADQEVLAGESAFDVVERDEALPVSSASDDDRAIREELQVERVHRLPGLEHRVVRRVHDGGDRAHPGGGEPRLDPEGRGDGHDIRDQPGQVPRTTGRVLDRDRRGGRCLPAGLGDRCVRTHERLPRRARDLARDAEHRQEVRPVRLDLEIEHDLVQAVAGLDVFAGRDALPQDEDPRVVGGDAELVRRADHPLGHDAPDLARCERFGPGGDPRARPRVRNQIAGRHVPDADDDLALRTSDVDPRDAERVGARMVPNLDDAGDHHAIEAVPWAIDRLDVHPLG